MACGHCISRSHFEWCPNGADSQRDRNVLRLPAWFHVPKPSTVLSYRVLFPKESGKKPQDKESQCQKEFLAPAGPGDYDQAVFGLGLLSPPAEVAREQKIGQDPVRETAIDEMSTPPPFLSCLSSWG